jgi:hypothetical protein
MMLQGRFRYPLLLPWRYLIPELFGGGWLLMAIIAMLTISAIPDVKRAAVDGGFRKRLLHTQRRSFHQPDKLYFLGLTVPHIPLRTHSRPLKLFLEPSSSGSTRPPIALTAHSHSGDLIPRYCWLPEWYLR